jgi:HEAT repeat protein
VNTSWESGGLSLNDAVLLAINNLDRSEREQAIDQAAERADPDQLVGLISVDDAIRRNAALEALGRGGGRSVPALIRALDDRDPEVVMFAASTLGKTRDPSAIPALAQILKHGDVNVCQAAVESLGALRAVSALGALNALLDKDLKDLWIRFSVVHTLGEIGDVSSVPTLVGLLGDAQLRESAITALGKVGGTAVLGELVQRLEANDGQAEFGICLEALGNALAQVSDSAALQALPFWMAFAERAPATIAPRLTEVLNADASGLEAAAVLARKEAAIELVRCLRLKACYPQLIALAADARLGETLLFTATDIGIALAPALTSAVGHKSAEIRRFACQALAAVSFEQGAAAVAPLLNDPDEAIRATALRVVARLHHTDALPEVVGRLLDHSPAVRGAATEALGRLDGRMVTLALLRNPQALAEQPRLALSIMHANPHPLQRPFLEMSLTDRRPGLREAAVTALAAQRPMDLAEILEPMLDDSARDVRLAAVSALTQRPSEKTRQLFLQRIERDPEARADLIRALGHLGDERLVPKLISIFRSCNPTEQTDAVDALGAIGSPSVEPFLARQLGHQDPRVRRHAVRALVHIGSASGLRRLAVAARDANARVRLTLSKALASCPHPMARPTLERLSVDSDAGVASAARADRR